MKIEIKEVKKIEVITTITFFKQIFQIKKLYSDNEYQSWNNGDLKNQFKNYLIKRIVKFNDREKGYCDYVLMYYRNPNYKKHASPLIFLPVDHEFKALARNAKKSNNWEEAITYLFDNEEKIIKNNIKWKPMLTNIKEINLNFN